MAYLLVPVFVLSLIFGFLVALGIGANDLANSFGTAYGSKVLNMKQLVVIAFICELAGAMLMGGQVAKTIRKGIADEKQFHNDPEQFMYGMMCALIATAAWLALATWKKLPVSTTHSIIGSIMGFALVFGGFKNGVHWGKKKDTFPYFGGVAPVFASWVISPVLSAGIAVGFFALLRIILLRSDPQKNALRWVVFFAVTVFVVMFFNIFFIFTKGFKNRLKWSKTKSAWVSVLIAIPFVVLAVFIVIRLLRQIEAEDLAKKEEAEQKEAKLESLEQTALSKVDATANGATHEEYLETALEARNRYLKAMYDEFHDEQWDLLVEHESNTRKTVLADVEEHSPATILLPVKKRMEIEQFSQKIEDVFKYLQIATSIIVSFAHGANDVSNGIGAVAAVFSVSKNRGFGGEAVVPLWLLAMGGVGIGIGLALFGRTILAVVGNDIVKLTPTRGFVSQFSAAVTVTIASVIGLPVSTTHCITGGVIGIGLAEDWRNAVEWLVVAKIAAGWVLTIIITAGTSALIYLPFFFAGTNSKN